MLHLYGARGRPVPLLILSLSLILGLLAALHLAQGGAARPPAAEQGLLHFQSSASRASAQRELNRGLLLYYAYNGPQAAEYFQRAADEQPRLAIAYWGIALASGPDINTPFSRESFMRGAKAMRTAVSLERYASPRERAYIDAMAARYHGNFEPRDAPESAYRAAMAKLVASYPGDDDASMLYAEAVLEHNSVAQIWHSQEGLRAAALLDRLIGNVLSRYPEHPMANHLNIHLHDYAPHHSKALQSGDRLAALDVEPAAEHLIHMAAHAYNENGDYAKSLAASARAIALANAAADRRYLFHDFEVGMSAAMNGASYQNAADFVARSYTGQPAGKAPLLMAVKTRFYRWDDILANHDDDGPSRVARIEALAAKGDGRAAASRLKALRLTDSSLSTLLLRSRVAIATGRGDDSVRLAQEAVTKEGGHKAELIPYSPALQTLGHAYYAMHRYGEAVHAFRNELRMYPGNGRALYGLWQSLQASGRSAAADAKRLFDKAWTGSDVLLSMNDL